MPSKLLLRSRLAHVELGRVVTEADYDVLVTGEVDVYKPDGARLCSVRRSVLSAEAREAARPVLRRLRSSMSYNRGLASGQDRTVAIKADGTRSNTAKSAGVPSAIIGYFDRYPRIPFCRQTAFNAQHTREFDELRPALEQLSSCFRASVSERYEAQMSQVQKTSPDFVIGGTPWTTITVNHNWSTCAHTDKGDLDEGFSCLAVLRQGAYRGGVLVFPAFRVGVDLLDGDLIMMDAHEVHGNTMLVDEGAAERISMVLYYRTKMRECGSAVEELARAKTIRGDLLTAEEEAELSP